eukprot:2979833-Pyramimonas_sp.AAC.1
MGRLPVAIALIREALPPKPDGGRRTIGASPVTMQPPTRFFFQTWRGRQMGRRPSTRPCAWSGLPGQELRGPRMETGWASGVRLSMPLESGAPILLCLTKAYG